MTGSEPKPHPRAAWVLAAAALGVVLYATLRQDSETSTEVPARAAGWHGAMSLYRNVAIWAGKHAMQAEMNYWKAVG